MPQNVFCKEKSVNALKEMIAICCNTHAKHTNWRIFWCAETGTYSDKWSV